MAEPIENAFSARRAAISSAAIVAFMLVFQPFGISVASLIDGLIVLGAAPLNFIVMLAAHEVRLDRGPWRTALTFGVITIANVAYFIFWSSEAMFMATFFKVGLIVLLAASAIGFWTRFRQLEAEVIELRSQPARSDNAQITFRGEGENEIFQTPASHLLYVVAQGNYTEFVAQFGDTAKSTLLRSTLTAVESQSDALLTRCHRSYLVNLSQIRRLISDRQGMRIEFANGTAIPVSRNYRKKIRSALTG